MRWLFKDFKAAKGVWGGVAFTIAVCQIVLTVLNSVIAIQNDMLDDPQWHALTVNYKYVTSFMLWSSLLMGVLVIFLVMGSAIRQRRRQLALLALQGATPLQLLVITQVQVIVISVAASLVAAVVAPLLLGPWTRSLALLDGHGIALPIEWQLVPWAWAQACRLFGCMVAVIGTGFTISALNRVSPVEGARMSTNPPARLGGFRAFCVVVVGCGAATLLALPSFTTAHVDAGLLHGMGMRQLLPQFQSIGNYCVGALVCIVCTLGLGAPVILKYVTKAWTALLAMPSPVWSIVRRQSVARIHRSSTTMVSFAAGLTLFFGLLEISAVSAQSVRDIPQLRGMTNADAAQMLTYFMGPLCIAAAGAIAGFVISARGRSLDTALVNVAGATPAQLKAMAALDGLIIITTTLIISLISTLALGGAFLGGIANVHALSTFPIPWGHGRSQP